MSRSPLVSMPASSTPRPPARFTADRSPATHVPLADLCRARFLCEGEDAQLTGMTRSPLRRLMALNLAGTLLPAAASPRSAAPGMLRNERIA